MLAFGEVSQAAAMRGGDLTAGRWFFPRLLPLTVRALM